MPLEWSDLKILLALTRAGSVAGAARDLKIDGSTVSRRLLALEEAVGAQLLIRGGREFIWTVPGKAMRDAAEAIEAATFAALRIIHAAKVDAAGRVRVSVAPAFVPVLIREIIPALRLTHPALSVELIGTHRRADLAKGEADIAVRMMRPEANDLVARRAFDCAWFVYASASYLQTRGQPTKADDLVHHDLVLYSESLHDAPPTRWMEIYGKSAPTASRFDSLETAREAALAGAGIVVLPAFTADRLPELRRVFPDSVAANTGWVVYHESVRNASRVRVVAEALAHFFQIHQSVFLGITPLEKTITAA